MFAFPGQGVRVLAPSLAYQVQAEFDGFPVQHAIAAVDPFPQAAGAQLDRGDRGLDGQAVQVLKVVVGHEPEMSAVRGVHGGLDLKIVGGPGHHAFLAVERLTGRHADEPGMLRLLIIVCGVMAAHRP